MNILDLVINSAESYLRRIVRNPIRIINQDKNSYIHYFFTNCIDEPLSELRLGGRLKDFISKHGNNFRFVNKNGDIITYE